MKVIGLAGEHHFIAEVSVTEIGWLLDFLGKNRTNIRTGTVIDISLPKGALNKFIAAKQNFDQAYSRLHDLINKIGGEIDWTKIAEYKLENGGSK